MKKLQLSTEFIKYFVTGITGFCVDTFVLNVFKFIVFNDSEQKILQLIFPSKVISSIAGLTVSFFLNRHWSFKASNHKIHYQAARFICVFFVNVLVAALLYTFFESIVMNIAFFPEHIIPTLANFLTSATQMIINFFVYKFFVFKV